MASNSIKRHIDATGSELDAFVLRLEKILRGKARQIVNDLYSGNDFTANKARDAASIIAQLDQVLTDADVQGQLGNLRQIYGKELHAIRDVYFADLHSGKDFYTGIDADVVETLIKFDGDTIATKLAGYVDDVRTTLMQGVLTGQIPDFLSVSDGAFPSNLTSEVQTMFSSFSRTVIAKKAKDVGLTSFEYIGPDDDLTRPFCRRTLEDRSPPVYTVDEINAMRPEPLGDAMVNCGGYNCRHQWRPVRGEG
jgi:hypothetical protein